jgi:hypothetical protein
MISNWRRNARDVLEASLANIEGAAMSSSCASRTSRLIGGGSNRAENLIAPKDRRRAA